jgi:hypothetical protein
MSTVKATHFEHPSASTAGITLAADGSVVLPQGFTGGIGSNVVQAVKTDVFTSSSTTYTALTGMSVSITPTSATSKILVLVNVKGASQYATSGSGLQYRLMRDSTPIYIGDAAGSATRSSGQLSTRLTGSEALLVSDTAVMLDSPSTTSAVAYSVEVRTRAGTLFINKPESSSTSDDGATRAASGITVIEVAA